MKPRTPIFDRSNLRGAVGRGITAFVLSVWFALPLVCAQDSLSSAAPATKSDAPTAQATPDADLSTAQAGATNPLAGDQAQVAQRFKRLEELLLKSAEIEAASNPGRAALLQQAAQLGKQAQLSEMLARAAKSLELQQYSQAVQDQKGSRDSLKKLLELLQSENRQDRVREQRDQVRRWIEETDRLRRLQSSLRGRTEGGQQTDKAAEDQAKLAEKASAIAKELGLNENASEGTESSGNDTQDASDGKPSDDKPSDDKPSDDKPSDDKPSDGKPSDGKPSDGKPSDGKPSDDKPSDDKPSDDKPSDGKPSDGNPSDGKPSDGKPSDDKPSDDKPSDNKPSDDKPSDGKPSDGKPSDGKPSDGKPSDGKPSDGKPSDGKPSDGKPSDGKPSDGKPGDESSESERPKDVPPASPTERAAARIQRAQQRMKDAKEQLDSAEREGAVEKQREAEQELQAAIEQLEEILRQLREEEIERSLAALEDRLRLMLQSQTKVSEETERLQEIAGASADRQVEIRASNLSLDERKILNDGQRALLLLREEGTSAAFPEAMAQMLVDIQSVVDRLAKADTGKLTVSIEQEIISSLEEMIEALVAVQKDQKKRKEQRQTPGQQPAGQSGDQPLVDQLAEMRLIRTLQVRINKRTQSLSEVLKDPNDAVGQTDAEDILSQLHSLSERQSSIKQVTRDIVVGKTK